jgi:hypothetical protein
LSQYTPVRPTLVRTAMPWQYRRNSAEVYWVPRSEWKIASRWT